MHLRDFLILEYEKQGWNVCSDFFESSTCLPDRWAGSFPDLLAIKGSRKEAICIENKSSFVGAYIPKKWKSMLQNPGVSLVIIVRDRDSYNLAVQTAKMHDIEIDCRVMRRIAQNRHARYHNIFKKQIYLFGLVGGLVIAFITFFLILPSARTSMQKHFMNQIIQKYQPKEIENQVELLKKEMDKYRKR